MRTLLSSLTLSLMASFALPVQAGNHVSQATLDCAYLDATAILVGLYGPQFAVVPAPTVVSCARVPAWGKVEYDDEGYAEKYTLYEKTFSENIPAWKRPGFNQNFAKGAVLRNALHELMHNCMGPSESACDQNSMSCLHALIDANVHTGLCAAAQEAKEDYQAAVDAGDDDEAAKQLDIFKGACASASDLEDKWNNEDGAAVMLACKAGLSNCNLSSSQSAAAQACGLEFPCPPDGGDDFEDNEVLEACDACENC